MKTLLSLLLITISSSVFAARDAQQMDYFTIGKCQAYGDIMELRGTLRSVSADISAQVNDINNRYWTLKDFEKSQAADIKRTMYQSFRDNPYVIEYFKTECM